jgi:hypothetical protein
VANDRGERPDPVSAERLTEWRIPLSSDRRTTIWSRRRAVTTCRHTSARDRSTAPQRPNSQLSSVTELGGGGGHLTNSPKVTSDQHLCHIIPGERTNWAPPASVYGPPGGHLLGREGKGREAAGNTGTARAEAEAEPEPEPGAERGWRGQRKGGKGMDGGKKAARGAQARARSRDRRWPRCPRPGPGGRACPVRRG